MNMDDIEGLKPDWTNRRTLIKHITYGLAAMLAVALLTSVILAYFAKFGLYISIFFTIFATLCFMTMLGVIGSYVFGARWETKDFLSILPGIIPDFKLGSSDNDYQDRDNDYRDYDNRYEHRYDDDKIPPQS